MKAPSTLLFEYVVNAGLGREQVPMYFLDLRRNKFVEAQIFRGRSIFSKLNLFQSTKMTITCCFEAQDRPSLHREFQLELHMEDGHGDPNICILQHLP